MAEIPQEMMKMTKLFLLGGQSNMVGSGEIKDLASPYTEALPAIRIWNSEKGWIPLAPGHDGRNEFGPDIAFGHEITELLRDDDVRFIKYAAGGTALYDDWSHELKGAQYSEFMRTANEAIVDLRNSGTAFEIAAMLWFQGESDAAEGQAESYEANLVNFIAHMREQFETPEMPFIIARVLSFYGGETGQAAIVRDAQVKVAEADPNAAWFDTDDSPVIDPQTNQGHYNAEGNLLNGRRFAEAVKPFLVKK
jgi:hypothetical protein